MKVNRRLLTRFYSFSFIICFSSKHTVKNATFIIRNLKHAFSSHPYKLSKKLHSYRMNIGKNKSLLFYLALHALTKSFRDFHKLLLLKPLGIISRFEEPLSLRLNRHLETRIFFLNFSI